MAVKQLSEHLWHMEPGPMDVHTHPRVFDAITQDDFVLLNNGQEGRAGLQNYTEAALYSGITAMIAMPNEIARRSTGLAAKPGLAEEERTEELRYPISNLDRVIAMQVAIEQQAYIPVGINFGLDPETLYADEEKTRLKIESLHIAFADVEEECVGLKVFADYSTGGNNIAVEDVATVVSIWGEYNFEKPVTIHAEGKNVRRVLHDIVRLPKGKNIPIHIAHVSSREELEAVIAAKEAGMNVTCEATPHHLFLDAEDSNQLGGYGCMLPSLKTQEDIDFLWANIDQIDMIASDCAPHRPSDKEKDNPAFGVTNHTVMLPLLFGAAADGKLTMEQMYDKLCVKPRERFNLPLKDNSSIVYDTTRQNLSPKFYEGNANARYGCNPFVRSGLGKALRYVGRVKEVQAGKSHINRVHLGADKLSTSYDHLIRPGNFK